MNNYTAIHLHSDYSLLDSCTQFADYIALAKSYGQTAIASTEHGKPMGWLGKKMTCDAAGIKFLHGVEIYMTEALQVHDADTGEMKKVRDNYHTILIAKNLDGLKELNRAVSISCDKEHTYFTNRMTFDEFLALSDNIIKTSACLSSPLNKLPVDHPYYERLVMAYDYLEVQPHNDPEQIAFNVHIAELAEKYHKPLIAGTDTHSLNAYKAKCRAILLEAKHKSYGNEDNFDLTYKSYDELIAMFRAQGALPEHLYKQAVENTNALADQCENWSLDTSLKYPILYGSREKDHEVLIQTIERKLQQKLDDGIIPPEQEQAFRTACEEEMRVFTKVEMDGFMLSMSELISWCKEHDIPIGPSRGSVGGSRVAYVTDIIDVNPEQWHTVFSRFCNEDRKEVGDIDVDCIDTDRPRIFEYIIDRFGRDKTARVASFGTVMAKGVIDDVCRAKMYQWNVANGYKYDEKVKENPYGYAFADRVKASLPADIDACMKDAKQKGKPVSEIAGLSAVMESYPDVMECFEGLWGTKVSQSVHPAGMVISPITLADNYGVFDKDGDLCLFADMEEVHDCGLVKYDLLILKTLKIIKDCCAYLDKPYPKMNEIDWNDQNVYDDMIKSPVGIFQFEGEYAHQLLRQYKPTNLFDVTIVTACIRPSGASYRDDLIARKPHRNPSKLIDELLSENNGYLVYQEDIIKFLQIVCGLSGSDADTVRRGIARKKPEILEKALPDILNGYCAKSPHSREEAEEEAKEFLKIIEDASSYMFGYNHAIGYSLLSYICAWLRCYHPLEFITSYLNNAANDDDIQSGSELAKEYKIQIMAPRYGESTDTYFFDTEKNVITKGVGSIRDMNHTVARALYDLSKTHPTNSFIDLLMLMREYTTLRSNQLDHLIKIDYFQQFGNIPTLTRILQFFDFLKQGTAKQIKKDKLSPTMESIIAPFATDKKKDGKPASSWTITDMGGLLHEAEKEIISLHLPDLDLKVHIQNHLEILGYIGIQTDRPEDRCTLIVSEVWPLLSKDDGQPWAYRMSTQSIGTGKTASLTAYANIFEKNPVRAGDIIKTTTADVYKNAKGYWYMKHWEKTA